MRTGAIGRVLVAVAVAACALVIAARPLRSQTGSGAAQRPADFAKLASVLTSPRCQNCHTLADFPRQGDDRHRHLFNVTRGADHGAPGLPCSACHGKSNNAFSGVPGAAEPWRLAPLAMAWDGLSDGELCRQLKDPQRNGHRDGNQIVGHLRSDLVAWAWSPGADRDGHPRTLPPISYQEFLQVAEAWVNAGAVCP